MTHGAHPNEVRKALRRASEDLRAGYPTDARLLGLADDLEQLAGVGWPPRGHQFHSTAPILLHRDDVARNVSSTYREGPFDIPESDRGLSAELVAELSRVRTDLDAHGNELVDLLISQGYFLTDAHLKIAMPRLVSECAGVGDPRGESLRPTWGFASGAIRKALADGRLLNRLKEENRPRLPFGRTNGRGRLSLMATNVALSVIFTLVSFFLIVLLVVRWRAF
jgi:hypothetical protein